MKAVYTNYDFASTLVKIFEMSESADSLYASSQSMTAWFGGY